MARSDPVLHTSEIGNLGAPVVVYFKRNDDFDGRMFDSYVSPYGEWVRPIVMTWVQTN